MRTRSVSMNAPTRESLSDTPSSGAGADLAAALRGTLQASHPPSAAPLGLRLLLLGLLLIFRLRRVVRVVELCDVCNRRLLVALARSSLVVQLHQLLYGVAVGLLVLCARRAERLCFFQVFHTAGQSRRLREAPRVIPGRLLHSLQQWRHRGACRRDMDGGGNNWALFFALVTALYVYVMVSLCAKRKAPFCALCSPPLALFRSCLPQCRWTLTWRLCAGN